MLKLERCIQRNKLVAPSDKTPEQMFIHDMFFFFYEDYI